MDSPCVAGVQLVYRPRVQPLKLGGVPDPHPIFSCDAAGLFNWYRCLYLQPLPLPLPLPLKEGEGGEALQHTACLPAGG